MRTSEDTVHPGDADKPALPYAKAFVVQFTAETDDRLAHSAGRVEHLKTGRRRRFTSVVELLACITTLLADTRTDSAPAEEPRAQVGQTGDHESGP